MSAQPFRSFEEFWPFYVGEHADPLNRKLHFVGTTLSMLCVGAAVVTRKKAFLAAAPLCGYGFAWVGHFIIEKNRPATFKHPLWSLRGDFRMWAKTIKGEMDAEVAKVQAAKAAEAEAAAPTATNGASSHDAPAAAPVALDPQTMN